MASPSERRVWELIERIEAAVTELREELGKDLPASAEAKPQPAERVAAVADEALRARDA